MVPVMGMFVWNLFLVQTDGRLTSTGKFYAFELQCRAEANSMMKKKGYRAERDEYNLDPYYECAKVTWAPVQK